MKLKNVFRILGKSRPTLMERIKKERERLEKAGVDFSKPLKDYRLTYSIWRGPHEVPLYLEREKEFQAHNEIHAEILAQEEVDKARDEFSYTRGRIESIRLVKIVVREKTVTLW